MLWGLRSEKGHVKQSLRETDSARMITVSYRLDCGYSIAWDQPGSSL